MPDGGLLLLPSLSFWKQEAANDSDFAARLSGGIDILVNDAVSASTRVLASTVGVAAHVGWRMAGLLMARELEGLRRALVPAGGPCVAIASDSSLWRKQQSAGHNLMLVLL